ncbi:hypothetical protein [Candidatus Poriferisodalis sp.]|uniref:hypothetical protein n=1 Tax=Candidatus Poriferisodalis sp. TaxID=3101277 RepID=UPI003D0FDE93
MLLQSIWIPLGVSAVVVGVTWWRLGPRVVSLARRWLRLYAQVMATILGAQIVAVVFFVEPLRQHPVNGENGDYLVDAARSMMGGALLSAAGLLAALTFASIVHRPPVEYRDLRRTAGRREKLAGACVVVGLAYAGIVHLTLMLPFVLLAPIPH